MSVRRLLCLEKVTNLGTNSSPQVVIAKFFMLIDLQKLHKTRILLRPRGRCEDVLGRPEDQLGTQASGTPNTVIVKVGLELGDVVFLDGRNAGDLPETVVVGVVRIAVVGWGVVERW